MYIRTEDNIYECFEVTQVSFDQKEYLCRTGDINSQLVSIYENDVIYAPQNEMESLVDKFIIGQVDDYGEINFVKAFIKGDLMNCFSYFRSLGYPRINHIYGATNEDLCLIEYDTYRYKFELLDEPFVINTEV